MLEVHLSTGRTLRFDLTNEKDAAEWIRWAKEGRMQAQITGLTLSKKDTRISLPRPVGFDPIFLFAEHVTPDLDRHIHGGERIVCTAGDIMMRIMAHENHRAARIDISREGRRTFNPLVP